MNGANIISNVVTERLKEHIAHELNGTNIMLVIQKQLFSADLSRDQNRLNLPGNQLQTHDFLTPDENERLDKGSADFYVPLLGPTLQMHEQPMRLVRWRLNTVQSLVLRTGWYHFVNENKDDLKLGATIQVWSFRMKLEDQNKLCLAIAVVKKAD
ncbi:B3 domain-containing protein-like protein [Tanacetum coccineum]